MKKTTTILTLLFVNLIFSVGFCEGAKKEQKVIDLEDSDKFEFFTLGDPIEMPDIFKPVDYFMTMEEIKNKVGEPDTEECYFEGYCNWIYKVPSKQKEKPWLECSIDFKERKVHSWRCNNYIYGLLN